METCFTPGGGVVMVSGFLRNETPSAQSVSGGTTAHYFVMQGRINALCNPCLKTCLHPHNQHIPGYLNGEPLVQPIISAIRGRQLGSKFKRLHFVRCVGT